MLEEELVRCRKQIQMLREEKTLGTSEGTLVTQTFYRLAPSFASPSKLFVSGPACRFRQHGCPS